MKIQFESVHFTPDEKLIDHITKKLEKLEQFHDRILSTKVTLKVGANKQIDDKIVEVSMAVPGDVIFGKKTDRSYEAALDGLLGALKKQLVKHKDTQRTH